MATRRQPEALPCRTGGLIGLTVLLMSGLLPAHGQGQADPGRLSPPPDSALFEAVVRDLSGESLPEPLRVDFRPLRADPRVVGAAEKYVADADSSVLEARRRVLERLAIDSTDALRDARCQGGLSRQLGRAVGDTAAPAGDDCPQATYVSAIVSLPRAGGSCWPGIDRITEGGRVSCEHATASERWWTGSWAMRVVVNALGPDGSYVTTVDYVLTYDVDDGSWSLEDRRRLWWSE